MPHIRALFVDTPEMRGFLKTHKTEIRVIVANTLRYPAGELAVIPESICDDDLELSDNLLPLEFVVDSGSRSVYKENECAMQIKRCILARCSGAADIQFGVWVRSHNKSGYAENEPKSTH